MSTFKILATFHSYWHIGTGRGSGYHIDSLVEKDASGLPYIPGKTIKGLMRDASYKLESWGHACATDSLYGKRGSATDETRNETTKGSIRFSSLELPEKGYLADKGELKSHLFQTLSSTAIDDETGVAKSQSLRMVEVTVPVKLEGEIEVISNQNLEISKEELKSLLAKSASLITNIGAHKNRGFGLVTLEIK